MHITQPSGLHLIHFCEVCNLFTIAGKLIPMWGPSCSRYSLLSLLRCFLVFRTGRVAVTVATNEMHVGWNAGCLQSKFFTLCPRENISQELPVLAITKPRAVVSVYRRKPPAVLLKLWHNLFHII